MQNENKLRELSDSIKLNNIHITGIPEGEEGGKGVENLFEEITLKTSQICVGNRNPDPGGTEIPPTKSTQGGPHQDT